MRRAVLLFVLALAVLAGCGADPTVRVISLGGGYGLADTKAGRHIELAATTVCVEDGTRATITGVRFNGANTPPVETFAVEPSSPDRAGASITDDAEPLTGGTKVRASCPKGETLVVGATMPSVRVDVSGITVTYDIDGTPGSASVPLQVSMCPPGQPGGRDCAP